MGTETGDDAAVYRLREDIALVQTVDFFPPIVDDPYQFGAIAVANALSDVYAMGATPILALNIVGFPVELPHSILVDILKGGYDKAAEAGVLIAGGHTIDDPEPKYGLAVTGLVRPGEQINNAGAKTGDALVLTKPIGTGIITTAGKNDAVEPEVLAGAVSMMMELNRGASEAMTHVGVSAATDITGFGLLGHLNGMMKGSGLAATVYWSRIPLLPGVESLADKGFIPGGTERNLKSLQGHVQWDNALPPRAKLVLSDAQTSGGLLMSLPTDKVDALMRQLKKHRVSGAVVVGEVAEGVPGSIRVLP